MERLIRDCRANTEVRLKPNLVRILGKDMFNELKGETDGKLAANSENETKTPYLPFP